MSLKEQRSKVISRLSGLLKKRAINFLNYETNKRYFCLAKVTTNTCDDNL